jgi:sugar O-acyltransferase (sialic acid O-acetyltransferase NeuD family)
MIIIGSGGFAKQLYDDLLSQIDSESLNFYDDVNKDVDLFLEKFPVISNNQEIKNHFNKIDNLYLLAIGIPTVKEKYHILLTKLGGNLTGIISKNAIVSKYTKSLESGINILAGSIIECGVSIHLGTNININCSITHDTEIGKYCEIGPGVQICGEVTIGDFCTIGAGAIILPKIKIGNKVIIGAGTVVNKDVPDNCVMIGVPAKRLQ